MISEWSKWNKSDPTVLQGWAQIFIWRYQNPNNNQWKSWLLDILAIIMELQYFLKINFGIMSKTYQMWASDFSARLPLLVAMCSLFGHQLAAQAYKKVKLLFGSQQVKKSNYFNLTHRVTLAFNDGPVTCYKVWVESFSMCLVGKDFFFSNLCGVFSLHKTSLA